FLYFLSVFKSVFSVFTKSFFTILLVVLFASSAVIVNLFLSGSLFGSCGFLRVGESVLGRPAPKYLRVRCVSLSSFRIRARFACASPSADSAFKYGEKLHLFP